MASIKLNKEGCIYNYFIDIKRQVDLKKELLKDDIDKNSDKLIQTKESLKF